MILDQLSEVIGFTKSELMWKINLALSVPAPLTHNTPDGSAKYATNCFKNYIGIITYDKIETEFSKTYQSSEKF